MIEAFLVQARYRMILPIKCTFKRPYGFPLSKRTFVGSSIRLQHIFVHHDVLSQLGTIETSRHDFIVIAVKHSRKFIEVIS